MNLILGHGVWFARRLAGAGCDRVLSQPFFQQGLKPLQWECLVPISSYWFFPGISFRVEIGG